jgi:hypothetical protein
MRLAGYVVTFLVAAGVVLGAAAAYGAVADTGVEDPPEIENEQYLDENLINDRSPGVANVQMSADVEEQTIVIDPGVDPQSAPVNPLLALLGGLGPETADRDIRPLVNTLIDNGHEIRVHIPDEQQTRRASTGDGPSELGKSLAGADAFVTFETEYSDSELADIETFSEEDGRVVYASDPGDEFDQPGAVGLESRLNVARDPGYVYNLVENDNNYQRLITQPADETELTAGVERAVFPTASPVSTPNGGAEMVPTSGARLSTSRAQTDAAIVARNGNVVIVGDTDFFTPENAQRADNDVFIGNLADFLVRNDRDSEEQPPTDSETESGQQEPQRPPLP